MKYTMSNYPAGVTGRQQLRENDMITCQMLATELDIDEDVLTELAWDIACQDADLTADYERLSGFPKYSLADALISDALVVRIEDSLDAVVAP